MLFFTAQNANYVGRMNPKTGEIKLSEDADRTRQPVRDGLHDRRRPVRLRLRHNKIIEIDPDTLAIKEYTLPNADSRPRRIAISPDDTIWYADYSRGYLGRLDPKTGKVERMAVAERPEVAALRHHLPERRDLVRRVGHQAERARALRSSRPRNSRAGSSRAAAASCATSSPPTMGNIVMAESGVNKIALVEIGGAAGSR